MMYKGALIILSISPSYNQYIKEKPHTKSRATLPHHRGHRPSPLKQFFTLLDFIDATILDWPIIIANNITIAILEHNMVYQTTPVVIMQYPQHYQYQEHSATAADEMHITAAAALSSINVERQQQPPIKKRRVSFKPTITVQPVDNLSKDPDQKTRLFYTKDEFEKEKTNIRRIAKDAMVLPSSSHCLSYPHLRGMEMYLCRPRVQNKHLARKAFLQYQRQRNINANTAMSNEEKQLRIAAASSKLSQWSRLVAIETARQDSYAAYGKDYLIPIDNNSIEIPPFPSLLSATDSKRRRVTVEEDDEISASAANSQASNKKRRF